MQEYGGQCDTSNHTADNHRHKVLTLAHELERQAIFLLRNKILRKLQHEVKRKNGKNGLHQELIA